MAILRQSPPRKSIYLSIHGQNLICFTSRFECLQDKLRDAFANASNTAILAAASNIFRVAMHDPRHSSALRSSASTLGTVDEANGHAGPRSHLAALEDVGMGGLANSFTFVPEARAAEMMNWTADLVSKMIE